MTIRRRDDAPVLVVSGLVAETTEWTVRDLANLPGRIADLGAVADGFTGEAVPVESVIEAATPLQTATHATVVGDDGLYRASIPLGELMTKGWVAFGHEGGLLPRDSGGPIRVVVPGGRTLCWNVKGVVAIDLTSGPVADSVPANPTH